MATAMKEESPLLKRDEPGENRLVAWQSCLRTDRVEAGKSPPAHSNQTSGRAVGVFP
jgi:hypothetical protein